MDELILAVDELAALNADELNNARGDDDDE